MKIEIPDELIIKFVNCAPGTPVKEAIENYHQQVRSMVGIYCYIGEYVVKNYKGE